MMGMKYFNYDSVINHNICNNNNDAINYRNNNISVYILFYN